MGRIFNSELELATRFLLILNEMNNLTIGKLISYDFICTYGADFDISQSSLHGDNEVRYSELSAKKQLAQKAIKLFIGYEYLYVINSVDGFIYSITPKGMEFCQSLNDVYCQKYQALVFKTRTLYSDYSDSSLLSIIHKRAVKKLGGIDLE